MKLYENSPAKPVLHIVDRLPESQADLNYLCKMFPSAFVARKSNKKWTLLSECKVKNLHWYE